MSMHGVEAIRAAYPQSDLERLREQKAGSVEEEKARLKEAARQFESLFAYQLLKTMRRTIPDNPLTKDVPMAGGTGKDIFTQMFDLQIAGKLAGQGQSSLAEVLYRSMVRAVEAQYGQGEQRAPIKPLRDESEPLPLFREPLRPLPKSGTIPFSASNPIDRQGSVIPNSSVDGIVAVYGDSIRAAADETGLQPELIYAVIKRESDGNPDAISRKGAKGLMQLMDTTATDYGVKRSFDPGENITAGSRYLKDLMDRFGGDLKKTLAAYNSGPATVERYGGVPPYDETQNYIDQVLDTMRTAGRLFR